MAKLKKPPLGEGRPETSNFPWQEIAVIATTPRPVQQKSDCTIAIIPKNEREEIRISLRSNMGRRFVALQTYAHNGVTMAPAHGLAIKPGALREVIDGLTRAEAALKAEARS
jgi:hypothetical protein